MIKNSPIVNDTRKVRKAISEKFDNDIDKYINYLLLKQSAEFSADNEKNETKHQQIQGESLSSHT